MGEYLSTPNKTKMSSDGEGSYLKYGASGMQGWRKGMEDAHITHLDVIPGEVSIFGVFDGHGGQEVAQFVEDNFLKEIQKLDSFKSRDYKKALTETFINLDNLMLTDAGTKQIAKIARKNGTIGPGMQVDEKELVYQAGCTATVALITPTEIYVANSGDTRAVLSSKGKAKDLSHDHKPDLPSEKRRIERAGGFVEEGRVNGIIAISRAIGDMEYKNRALKPEETMVSVVPEVIVEPMKPDHEFLIIACDGIWDCMTSQQCVTFCAEKFKQYKQKKQSSEEVKSPGNASASTSASSPSKTNGVKKQMTSGSKTGGSGYGQKSRSPTKVTKKPAGVHSLSKIMEMCMDKCCPMDLANSDGIGTDNMTAIIIEFVKH